MKAAKATVMAMSQGLTLGFQGVWRDWFGLSTCFVVGAAAAWAGAAGCNSGKGLSSGLGAQFAFQVIRGRGSAKSFSETAVLLCRFG
jgi:hypothetical protein